VARSKQTGDQHITIPPHGELVAALAAAGVSHHDYEQGALEGVHDQQWPGFYAAYVLGRLGDFASPTILASWLQSAPDAAGWASSAAHHVLQMLAAGSDPASG